MVKPENGIKSGYGDFAHVTTIVASNPGMNIAEDGNQHFPFRLLRSNDVLVDAFGREIIGWRLPLCVPGRRKSVVVGEIVLREQTIDGFPEWVGARRVIAKVFRHLVVVFNAVDPGIGEGGSVGRRASARRHAFIVLAEHDTVECNFLDVGYISPEYPRCLASY
jgi:hypothetical protein